MLIGDGQIGVEPFRRLFADRRSRGIPLILETPQLNMEIADDDASPDPYDVQMMALLDRASRGRNACVLGERRFGACRQREKSSILIGEKCVFPIASYADDYTFRPRR